MAEAAYSYEYGTEPLDHQGAEFPATRDLTYWARFWEQGTDRKYNSDVRYRGVVRGIRREV
jgi:hypothetical protein|tara:strand:+ start:2365 stop:2547 length:183 start_codon:yes stop_codon:yes gene_type:complete